MHNNIKNEAASYESGFFTATVCFRRFVSVFAIRDLVIEDTYWRLYWCDPGVGGYLLIQLKVYSCGNDEELDKMVNKDVIKKMDNEMDNGLELMVEEVGWKQMKMAWDRWKQIRYP